MKKVLLAVFVTLLCVTVASAQKDQRDKGTDTKKGYNILPAKGDFALGISANPFLNYGTSLLSGGSPAPTFNGFGGRIYGKYFTRDNQAFRFGIGLVANGNQQRGKVRNDEAYENDSSLTPDDDVHLFDKMNTSNTDVTLFVGYEWRRGYGRLQGFYGVQAGLDFHISTTSYNWANEMTVDRPNPSSTMWPGSIAGSRVLKNNGPNSIGFNLGGFVGVEYFFARKMSLGAELGVGFAYANTGKSKRTTETINNGEHESTTRVVNNGGASNWALRTDINGNIFLMFHF